MSLQPRTALDTMNTKDNDSNPYTTKENEMKNTVINVDIDSVKMKELSRKNGGIDRIQNAISNGVSMGLGRGALLGFPVQNICVNLTDIRLDGMENYWIAWKKNVIMRF